MKRSGFARKSPADGGAWSSFKPKKTTRILIRSDKAATVRPDASQCDQQRDKIARVRAKRSTKRSESDKARAAERAAAKLHMGRVAGCGCMLCIYLGIEGTPAEVHHVRKGSGKMRASHFDTIPLCPPHHRLGKFSFHELGTNAFARHYGVTEAHLLAMTRDRLGISTSDTKTGE